MAARTPDHGGAEGGGSKAAEATEEGNPLTPPLEAQPSAGEKAEASQPKEEVVAAPVAATEASTATQDVAAEPAQMEVEEDPYAPVATASPLPQPEEAATHDESLQKVRALAKDKHGTLHKGDLPEGVSYRIVEDAVGKLDRIKAFPEGWQVEVEDDMKVVVALLYLSVAKTEGEDAEATEPSKTGTPDEVERSAPSKSDDKATSGIFLKGERVQASIEDFWYDAVCLEDEKDAKVKVKYDIDDSELVVDRAQVRHNQKAAQDADPAPPAEGKSDVKEEKEELKDTKEEEGEDANLVVIASSEAAVTAALPKVQSVLKELLEELMEPKLVAKEQTKKKEDAPVKGTSSKARSRSAAKTRNERKRGDSEEAWGEWTAESSKVAKDSGWQSARWSNTGASWQGSGSGQKQKQAAPEYYVGDVVEALFQDYWYKATVEADEKGGKVKVHFEIDDSHLTVQVHEVRPLPASSSTRGSGGRGGKTNQPLSSSKGQQGMFDNYWADERNGKDSGWQSARWSNTGASWQGSGTGQKQKQAAPEYYAGDVVEALFQDYWYKATVEADEKGGKVKVHFEIDDSRLTVQVHEVRPLPASSSTHGSGGRGGKMAPPPLFSKGQQVEAMFENYWYIATCLSDERNGKVRVHFDIDDSKLEVSSAKVREVSTSKKRDAATSSSSWIGRTAAASEIGPSGRATRQRIASHRDRGMMPWWARASAAMEEISSRGRPASQQAPSRASRTDSRARRRSARTGTSGDGTQAERAGSSPKGRRRGESTATGRSPKRPRVGRKEGESPSPARSIRICGVSHLQRKAETLLEAFRVVGKIESVRFVTVNEAVLTFESHGEAKKAADTYNGGELLGHDIEVYLTVDNGTGPGTKSASDVGTSRVKERRPTTERHRLRRR